MPKAILSHGLSTSGSIHLLQKQRKEPTYLIGCYENFAHGPLTSINDLAKFADMRAEYWKGARRSAKVAKWLADIERDRSCIDKAKTIEIWVGTTVQEQIFLLTSLEFLKQFRFEISLVKINQFPANDARPTLDFYTDKMLADGPTPTLMDQDTISRYENAWLAVSDPSPEKLVQLIQQGSGSAILDDALLSFFQRYPSISNGLGSLDQLLLSSLPQEWTKSPYVIGNAMGLGMTSLDYAGDGILFDRLVRMGNSALSNPMVELRGDSKQMRSCEVRLTRFGSGCLEGKQNNVLVNGIEDWVGGVRLSSRENSIWLRDRQTLVAQQSPKAKKPRQTGRAS